MGREWWGVPAGPPPPPPPRPALLAPARDAPTPRHATPRHANANATSTSMRAARRTAPTGFGLMIIGRRPYTAMYTAVHATFAARLQT